MPAIIEYSDALPPAPDGMQNNKYQLGTGVDGIPIADIEPLGPDNTAPYLVTTIGAHGLATGDVAFVQAGGFVPATGTWIVDVTGGDQFQIDGSGPYVLPFRPSPSCVVLPATKVSSYPPPMVGAGAGLSPPEDGLGGAVPQPKAGDNLKFLCGDGTWQDPAIIGIGDFVGDGHGSPPSSGGRHGLVPAPAAGDAAAEKFLSAGGDWETLPVFTGVSGSPPVAGEQGVVPAPGSGDGGKFLSSSGDWETFSGVPTAREIVTHLPLTGGGPLVTDLELAINDFTGVSGSPPVAGASGAVPAPGPSDEGKFLSSSGGWKRRMETSRHQGASTPLLP